MRGGRYEARGVQAEYQPGSRGRVLRNLLDIRSVREMAQRESEALLAATHLLTDQTTVDQQFNVADIRRMHR